jgi:hypothetical protein
METRKQLNKELHERLDSLSEQLHAAELLTIEDED